MQRLNTAADAMPRLLLEHGLLQAPLLMYVWPGKRMSRRMTRLLFSWHCEDWITRRRKKKRVCSASFCWDGLDLWLHGLNKVVEIFLAGIAKGDDNLTPGIRPHFLEKVGEGGSFVFY